MEIMRKVVGTVQFLGDNDPDHPQVLQHHLSHHLPAVCQRDVRQAHAELHLCSALERQTGEQSAVKIMFMIQLSFVGAE